MNTQSNDTSRITNPNSPIHIHETIGTWNKKNSNGELEMNAKKEDQIVGIFNQNPSIIFAQNPEIVTLIDSYKELPSSKMLYDTITNINNQGDDAKINFIQRKIYRLILGIVLLLYLSILSFNYFTNPKDSIRISIILFAILFYGFYISTENSKINILKKYKIMQLIGTDFLRYLISNAQFDEGEHLFTKDLTTLNIVHEKIDYITSSHSFAFPIPSHTDILIQGICAKFYYKTVKGEAKVINDSIIYSLELNHPKYIINSKTTITMQINNLCFNGKKTSYGKPVEERIPLEHTEFEKYFEVFSSDPIEARMLLTPTFMEKLCTYIKRYPQEEICLIFEGNCIYFRHESAYSSIVDYYTYNYNFQKIELVYQVLYKELQSFFEFIEIIDIEYFIKK